MAKQIGYKQSKVYFNDKPEITAKISNLSRISKSKFNPNLKNAETVDEMLKRPDTYNFTVLTLPKGSFTSFLHSFYFDSETEAKKEHKKLLLKYYDQKTEPFLAKLNKNRKLTKVEEKQLLKNISDVFESK